MTAEPTGRHPVLTENDEEEEVTAVTHELNQLRADVETCKAAAARTVRASDSLTSMIAVAPRCRERTAEGHRCDLLRGHERPHATIPGLDLSRPPK